MSVVELLLSIGLTVILFSSTVLLMGFLGKDINQESIIYEDIKYLKAPSHDALNKALELNLKFMEQCRMANGAVVLGGRGITLKNEEFESCPLNMNVSIESVQNLVDSKKELLLSSHHFFQGLEKEGRELLERLSNSKGFTVLLFNNDYQLLCICQVRQYNLDGKVLFRVQLKWHNDDPKAFEYNFYVSRADQSIELDYEVTRTSYFLYNQNGLILSKEGVFLVSLPDPYLIRIASAQSGELLSRFNYYIDAKK